MLNNDGSTKNEFLFENGKLQNFVRQEDPEKKKPKKMRSAALIIPLISNHTIPNNPKNQKNQNDDENEIKDTNTDNSNKKVNQKEEMDIDKMLDDTVSIFNSSFEDLFDFG